MDLFADSTGVNPANLNKLLGAGGVYSGMHIFSMNFKVKNNGGTFQYQLYTSNNVESDQVHVGDLGATHVAIYTNVGDGNVTKTGIGHYDVVLSGITKLFVLYGNLFSTDSNVTQIIAWGKDTTDMITVEFRNASGTLTDLADTKTHDIRLMGLYIKP